MTIKLKFNLLIMAILCTSMTIPVKSEPFIKILQGQKELYYTAGPNDSLTFPTDLKGYHLAVNAGGVKDTLAPSSFSGMSVVDINRIARLVVKAGPSQRTDIPVSAISEGALLSRGPLKLVEIIGNQRIETPWQFDVSDSARIWWILSGTTLAGAERVFELQSGTQSLSPLHIQMAPAGDLFNISWDNQLMMTYVVNPIKPPGLNLGENYARSGYINQMFSPTSRKLITEDGAGGHPHHRSIFFAWVSLDYKGRYTNIWDNAQNHGNIYFEEFKNQSSGPVYSGFTAKNRWIEYTDDTRLIHEEWDVKIWNVGGPEKGYWLWDLTVTHTPGTTTPVTVNRYDYGGMCVKGAGEWSAGRAEYLTDQGEGTAGAWGLNARWNSISGDVSGDQNTISLLSSSENLNHPEPAQNYPDLNYIGYSPTQNGSLMMEPGQKYVFKYRLYVNEGGVNTVNNNLQWEAFGNPPAVTYTPLN